MGYLASLDIWDQELYGLGRVTTQLTCLIILYRLGVVVYRLYFHPLARFPGPTFNAASFLPYLYAEKLLGRFCLQEVKDLHEKYGPFVRVSPNRLAVAPEIAWQDVFGHRGAGHAEFGKDRNFYQNPGSINAVDRDNHRRQRRQMSPAFSDTALYQQEVHIKRYVDMLMDRLRERAGAHQPPVDMVKWFNYTTFDVIGDLAFAEPFDCLAQGEYHPWIAMIFGSIKASANLKFFAHYTLLQPLVWLLVSLRGGQEKRRQFNELGIHKTQRRLALGPADDRKDFMTYILQENDSGDKEMRMTLDEIVQNSRVLIAAGSETTASALSGLTYYLMHHPEVYRKLADEIRSSFKSEEDICMRSTANLPYLMACIEEGLRIYPPVPETPPRISPGDMVGGHYIPAGTLISVYQWAANHSEHNFVEADKLIPERWLPQSHPLYDSRFSKDKRIVCRPFSAGARDCLGRGLAYAEMRLILCRLFWNFDLELAEGYEDWLKPQRVFIVWGKGPLLMKLIPRQLA
ncbi:cytochrome P450 3A17 [Xylariales sp. PMI_506]|nr:cytochrome P450 3A17 [Xylariales sp. PMI_506]